MPTTRRELGGNVVRLVGFGRVGPAASSRIACYNHL
jgi:hypothetical protein